MMSRFVLFLFLPAIVVAQFGDSPFSESALLTHEGGAARLEVTISIPADHYLYADQLAISSTDSTRLTPLSVPDPVQKKDPFLGETVAVYGHTTTFVYSLNDPLAESVQVRVSYQGCDTSTCFMPQSKILTVNRSGVSKRSPVEPQTSGDSAAEALQAALREDFIITGRAAGYLKPQAFIDFLGRSVSDAGEQADELSSAFDRNIWLALFLILVGGLALNLTPCVLPMIPINIAIIGAGANAGSRLRGLALGTAYGAGIALVYGGLGIAAVMTGARFGSLNSLPAFNLIIALIFVLMALAMLDIVHVDLSRFQTKAGPSKPKSGSFPTALLLGGIAALLAGACVAPVVISVLLLSADVYSKGNPAGLVLPLLLGVGMALPWPFAGAGLSFLPRPGKWMSRVKTIFALLIFAMAVYYGRIAFSQFRARHPASRAAVEEAQQAARLDGWLTSLDAALEQSRASGKPVLLDFWASWCKNCLTMDKTTFKDAGVQAGLQPFVKAKIRAENLRSAETAALLDVFDVKGLPAYIVLMPRESAEN